MRIRHILFYLGLGVIMNSCSTGSKKPSVIRQLDLGFDSTMIHDSAILRFKFTTDAETEVEFSKGIQKPNFYSISINEYAKTAGPVYINIYAKSKSRHWFHMELDSSSPSLDPQFVKNLSLDIKDFKMKDSSNRWLYIFIALGLLIFLLTWYWFYHRNNAFDSGHLDISHPITTQKALTGKMHISLGKLLDSRKNDCFISCEVIDIQKGSLRERRKRPLLQLNTFFDFTVNNAAIDQTEWALSDEDSIIIKRKDNPEVFLQFTFKNI